MYSDSNDKKDNNLRVRVSTNQKKKIEQFMKENGIKSLSDFINSSIEMKLNNGGRTLFNM